MSERISVCSLARKIAPVFGGAVLGLSAACSQKDVNSAFNAVEDDLRYNTVLNTSRLSAEAPATLPMLSYDGKPEELELKIDANLMARPNVVSSYRIIYGKLPDGQEIYVYADSDCLPEGLMVGAIVSNDMTFVNETTGTVYVSGEGYLPESGRPGVVTPEACDFDMNTQLASQVTRAVRDINKGRN